MTDADKSGVKQRGRPFRKGESGNPAGRKLGSRSKSTLLGQALMSEELEGVVRKCVEMALGGDSTCIKVVIDKLIPSAKSHPICLPIDPPQSTADIPRVLLDTFVELYKGTVHPEDIEALIKLVGIYRDAVSALSIEARLTEIEQRIGGSK